MSNWATDAVNDENILNPDMQWKVKVRSIEENLRKLRQDTDNMAQKFIWVKANNGTYDGFQHWIHRMTDSFDEITRNMDDLTKLVPKKHDMEYVTKNTQIKQLSQRVENQMKHNQNLSSDIQKEMEKGYIAKRMAASVISEQCENGDNRMSDSVQTIKMATLEDPQLVQALEEQQQCEKLTKDIVQLESMMVKISGMIHEQAEVVEQIHSNVEEALQKTDEGVQQLHKAVEHKKAFTKKRLIIIAIVIASVLLLGLVIFLCYKFG